MQPVAQKARALVARLTVWANWLAALALALMVIHITVDVVLRYLYSAPLTGTIEVVSAYYMVAVIALPLAYVHLRGQHIKVDLFTARLSPRRVRQLDWLVELLMLIMFTGIAVLSFQEAIVKTRAGEVWEAGQGLLPVWPSRWSLAAGFGLMALVSLVRLVLPPESGDSEYEASR